MSLAGGIDLGGTNMQAAVVEADGSVVGTARRATPTSGGPEALTGELAEAMREAIAAAGVESAALAGVGIGYPGVIDVQAGTVLAGVNLPRWEGPFGLVEQLGRELGMPVHLGNDVQVATDAEYALGAGRGYNSLLGVFWGSGVGGGIVLDGRSWAGRGAAGEIGHVVVRERGRRCPCGRRGCLEAYAGRIAMERRARRLVQRGEQTILFDLMQERGRERLTSGIWERALAQHDPLAVRLIDRAVRALGTGIASALNLLDVEAVVIGGGLGVRLGPLYIDRIHSEVMKHLFADDRPPKIWVTELGDNGGAIGASLLVRSAA